MFTARAPSRLLRPVIGSVHRTISTFTLPTSCPSCKAALASSVPACLKCGTISTVPVDVNNYSLLGIPYEPHKFALDEADLQKRFRRAQAACHPDVWTAKGEGKKDVAQDLSSRVNDAYKRLRDPLSRLNYLLELNGVALEATDKLEDEAFLMKILSLRDDIDEATEREDVEATLGETQENIENALEEVTKHVSEGNWAAAKSASVRLKYLEGVRAAGKEWIQENE
ncbi:Co-chaperone Hsc20 [Cylindrobasidium torrendii FP15055 ss-10]|uniref:Co-chaperone Hsc20 n=1 Tax=Cylindrobasidium torrendii FP15055 ss-10 TaxID=1314674 RepID=A0A0D7BN63_9AGAR|nr:Co-chaperone Hsc20 [Cylindrobasidium torrendii FP15055 ss-10]